VLATNDLDTPAQSLLQRYKDRCQIELFFKWIKQHLKIKCFLGRSENARTHSDSECVISYLLLALYKKTHGFTGSLWMLLGELRARCFSDHARSRALSKADENNIKHSSNSSQVCLHEYLSRDSSARRRESSVFSYCRVVRSTSAPFKRRLLRAVRLHHLT